MDSSRIVVTIHGIIEIGVAGIESLAVVVIATAILFGSVRFVFHLAAHYSGAYDSYKVQLGKALLLGLELLVAADVVRTVAFEPTLESVAVLGLLVLVRVFEPVYDRGDRRPLALERPSQGSINGLACPLGTAIPLAVRVRPSRAHSCADESPTGWRIAQPDEVRCPLNFAQINSLVGSVFYASEGVYFD